MWIVICNENKIKEYILLETWRVTKKDENDDNGEGQLGSWSSLSLSLSLFLSEEGVYTETLEKSLSSFIVSLSRL